MRNLTRPLLVSSGGRPGVQGRGAEIGTFIKSLFPLRFPETCAGDGPQGGRVLCVGRLRVSAT